MVTLKTQRAVLRFLQDAFVHCKPLGAIGEGVELLRAAHLDGIDLADAKSADKVVSSRGVVTAQSASKPRAFEQALIEAIAQHRHWDREEAE